MPRVEKSKPLRIPESNIMKSPDKNTNNKKTKRIEPKTDDRTMHNDQGLECEDELQASDNYDFIRTVEKMKQMEKQIEQNLFEAEPFNIDDDTQLKIQNQVNVVPKPEIDRKVSYKKINDRSLNKIPIKKGKENQVSVTKALKIEDQNKIHLKNKEVTKIKKDKDRTPLKQKHPNNKVQSIQLSAEPLDPSGYSRSNSQSRSQAREKKSAHSKKSENDHQQSLNKLISKTSALIYNDKDRKQQSKSTNETVGKSRLK